MAINKLSPEQEAILRLLSNYGCLDMSQLYAIYEQIGTDSIDMFVKWLIKMRRIDLLDGRFLILRDAKSSVLSQNALSCIWTMIKLSNSREDIISSFKAADPAFAYMTVENKDSYILVPVSGNETIKIRAIQEKIAKEHRSKSFKASYVFVTTDENVRNVIKGVDFEDTANFAFLTYDKSTRIPSTKILRKSVKAS